MDKLTKEDLREMWAIYFKEENAEMCFNIDAEYLRRYGSAQFHIWASNRIM
jgi:hypothetical protein